jgi:hypothetical protein
MKVISAFISVMLSSLSLLAPTDAAPVDLMAAHGLPDPVSVAVAKTYLDERGYIVNYRPSKINHTLVVTIKPEANGDTYVCAHLTNDPLIYLQVSENFVSTLDHYLRKMQYTRSSPRDGWHGTYPHLYIATSV